ncbi:hypothetical protein BDN72DRAFT_898020 [Pluteus cervinus]|uniref:Uncharacterized protein n=1 Tax=Pluteus cervinus TaxID=181527 RepID=A0ACD3ATF1_9AGAR|nr:hypothetical protein BDN72DRAFT_898020 [Pluteus cervinus]
MPPNVPVSTAPGPWTTSARVQQQHHHHHHPHPRPSHLHTRLAPSTVSPEPTGTIRPTYRPTAAPPPPRSQSTVMEWTYPQTQQPGYSA